MAAPALKNWYNSKTALPKPTGMIGEVKNWQVDPNQTVAGQVTNVVKKDSPLMQQAQTEGMQQAQERGLLNSSVGISAAQDSVYKAALPIAQADAAQYSRAAGYNVDTYNKANEFNANNTFNRQERVANNAYDWQKNKTNNAYDFTKTQYTAGKDRDNKLLDHFGELSKTYNMAVTSINQDPNMTQLAKNYAIKQLYDAHKAEITMLSAVGKVPNVSKLLAPSPRAVQPKANYRNYIPVANSSGGGGKIICTRLHALGLMDDKTFLADSLYGELTLREDPGFMHWYWRHAQPIVDRMHGKTFKSKLFIRGIWLLATPWAQQMAFEMGQRKTGSLIGKTIMKLGKWAYQTSKTREDQYA
jgi:hypothetical protein